MAPIRTKGKKPLNDGKQPQFHKKPQKDSNTLPGVQKIKASLRQTRRLLAKDKLAADVRVATERRLKALEADLHRAELARKERTLAIRYHKVKFFERQKVVRKINQTKKRLASAGGDKGVLETRLFDLRVDLNYILHFPKTEKYISLFPPEVRKGEPRQLGAEAAKTDVRRHELRSWIKEKMNSEDLPAVPEEESARVSAGNFHEPERNDGRKGKEIVTGDGDGIEEDGFFGEDSDSDSENSLAGCPEGSDLGGQ